MEDIQFIPIIMMLTMILHEITGKKVYAVGALLWFALLIVIAVYQIIGVAWKIYYTV